MVLAQFRLLQRCCTTIASSLREHSLLQGARLIVISRLLLKSLSEQAVTSRSLDFLRTRLAGLRTQLLLRVDSRLSNPTASLPVLLESICSYCLATSTFSEDAMDHLRHIRIEKIRRQLATSQQLATICGALRYQLSSLQTFSSMIGRPMVEAMNNLQRKPILADPSIRNLESLDLDRILSLIPDDIESFVPYFKRSALTSEETEAKLEEWSRDACRVFIDALRQSLLRMNQVDAVLDLRRRLYTLLLPSYFSVPAGSFIKEQIAHVINEKVRMICHSQGLQLHQSTDLLLDESTHNKMAKSLWDEDLALFNLDAGAKKLIRQISMRHAGHVASSSKALRALERWVAEANATLSQFDEISKIRWRDILEEPDEENEDDATALIKTLGDEDPKHYRDSMRSELQDAVLKHESALTKAADQAIKGSSDLSNAVALLRSIRLSMVSLQHAFPEHAKFHKIQAAMPKLLQLVADEVAEQLSSKVRHSNKAIDSDKGLLPGNMPSPRAFSTLRRLCKIMTDVGGTDLWSPPLVERVKKTVSSRVFDVESKAAYMDHEFDEVYMSIALGRKDLEMAQDGAKAKELAKSASEYWTRTKLLFGVLA